MKQIFNGVYKDAVSQQIFANKIEKSRSYLRGLIDKGIIPVDKNGKISMSEGLKAWMDFKKTAPKNSKPQVTPKKKTVILPDDDSEGDLALDDEAELNAMIDRDPVETFNRMRCLETAYKAKLKKLEYQEEAKQLYRFEDICRDLSEVFTVIRGELLAIPQRVAGRCEGRDTREIEEILDNEINSALEHIQKSKFAEKCTRSSSS